MALSIVKYVKSVYPAYKLKKTTVSDPPQHPSRVQSGMMLVLSVLVT